MRRQRVPDSRRGFERECERRRRACVIYIQQFPIKLIQFRYSSIGEIRLHLVFLNRRGKHPFDVRAVLVFLE